MPYVTTKRQRMARVSGGTPTVATGRLRPCPQCPAEISGSCLRWVSEGFPRRKDDEATTHPAGRWERMVKLHPARTATEANKQYAAFLDPDQQRACTDTDRHRGHQHGDNSELYCRGRL